MSPSSWHGQEPVFTVADCFDIYQVLEPQAQSADLENVYLDHPDVWLELLRMLWVFTVAGLWPCEHSVACYSQIA